MFLPAAVSLEAAEDEASIDVRAAGNEHILFVDDESAIREVAERGLAHHGYGVTIESDPHRALETFRADPDAFALAVLDLVMPKMGGDVLAQELLAIRPDLPIAVCSAYGREIVAKRHRPFGIRAFVSKPFGPHELCLAVRRALDGEP